MSPTPILDLEQSVPEPPRVRSRNLIRGVAIGALIGGVLAWLSITNPAAGRLLSSLPSFSGVVFLLYYYPLIALNELGHATAAYLAGIHTAGLSIGPFSLLKSRANWIFRFDRRKLSGGFFKPLTRSLDLKTSSVAWMVAGGPLASLLVFTVVTVVWMRSPDGIWLGSLFWAALWLLLLALMPCSAGLETPDVARLLQLRRNPRQARSWIAAILLQTADTEGVRPRDWPADVFQHVLHSDPAAHEYPRHQMSAFYRAIDTGDRPAAMLHLETALASSLKAGQPFRHAIFAEAAYVSAMIRHNGPQARIWRDRALAVQKPEAFDVVEAAIAQCEGRYDAAIAHWQAARARADRLGLDSGFNRFATENWAEAEALCETLREAAKLVN